MDPLKNSPPPESKLHFLDYWRIIRIRKAIIVTVFLITAIIATAVTFILPESYASTARVIVKPDGADIPGMDGEMRATSGDSYNPYFIQTTFELMQSQVVLSNVINRLDLNEVWGKKYNNGETFKTLDTMEILKDRMSLSPVRNTEYITITVYSDDKNEAANIANAIAESYRDYRFNVQKERADKSIDVLEQQFQDEEAQINQVQTNLDYLRTSLGVTYDNPDSESPTPTLTAEQLQHYADLEIEGEKVYQQMATQLATLQSMPVDKLRDVLPSINPDTTLSGLVDKLHEAEQQYAVLTNDYSLTNLVVVRVQSEIDELNRETDARVTGLMASLATQVQAEKASVDGLTASVTKAKEQDVQQAAKTQPYWDEKLKLTRMLEFHKLLAAKIEQTRLDSTIPTTSLVQITDRAEPGKTPVKPNKTVNIILGLVFGLVMGVGLAFFIEYLDTSVKTIDDVERAFQAPVLGVIPQNVGYLLEEGPESKYAEAYRVLRTNILFSRKDEKLNSIVVVSAGAGEGKSTTTLNLATVFAQNGSRVLVVDSDLRRPTLHKLLRVTNNLGLTNYLLKQNTLTEVVQPTSLATLDFIASGKLPNSAMGILGSAQMKEMIDELKHRYDYVFFDSPPILGVSDASILASEMDLVIQVIQYRRYPQPMNIRAKQMIEKVGGNFIGIVLNNINMSQDESYYYYSGYYHDYYYSRTEGEQEAEAAKPGTAAGGDAETGIKQKY